MSFIILPLWMIQLGMIVDDPSPFVRFILSVI